MKPITTYTTAIALLLAVQSFDIFITSPPGEGAPPNFLRLVSTSFGEWQMLQESRFDEDILGALAPDDYLVRLYSRDDRPEVIELVIAHFRSQAKGFGPHSPQVCLPASGWLPVSNEVTHISDGGGRTFPANLYILRNGKQTNVVLYWYHSTVRASAGEIEARMWLAWDALTGAGNDISLVRVIIPASEDGEAIAVQAASAFAGDVYRDLRLHRPAR